MESSVTIKYISMQRRNRYLIVVVAIVALGVALWSVFYGVPTIFSQNRAVGSVVLTIRATRVCSAFLVGAILSLSGVVMQSLLRNPLASPYTLGVSNAAAFGAAIGIVCFENIAFPGVVTISAFTGALVGLAIIMAIARIQSKGIETVILAGVVINSLFAAGIAIIQYVANSAQMATILFWNFGDLGKGDWSSVILLAIVAVAGGFYLYGKRWDYKALETTDEYAKSLGVEPKRVRLVGLIVSSLITAVAVSIFGVIAFVGLAVPHIVRRIIGGNLTFLIPSSMLFGGVFLVVCDIASRQLFSPIVIPIGIITSLIGVPLFLVVLCKIYKR